LGILPDRHRRDGLVAGLAGVAATVAFADEFVHHRVHPRAWDRRDRGVYRGEADGHGAARWLAGTVVDDPPATRGDIEWPTRRVAPSIQAGAVGGVRVVCNDDRGWLAHSQLDDSRLGRLLGHLDLFSHLYFLSPR